MSVDRYSQGVYAPSEVVVATGEQWVIPPSPAPPKEVVPQFDRTDLRLLSVQRAIFDFATTIEWVATSSTVSIVSRVFSELIEDIVRELRKEELKQLVAFSHTIETDPERLRRLREAVGEPKYSCYILWLVNRPFDALPEAYRAVEIELYRLARYNSDVNVAILDSTKYPTIVTTLMKTLEIDTLPALVVSPDPIDLENPRKENTIVFKSGALERLARQGRLLHVISNIPNWARMGILRDKARWESEIVSLLAEVWNQIKHLVSINLVY